MPFVSSTNAVHPCAFAASPVSSSILVLIHPTTDRRWSKGVIRIVAELQVMSPQQVSTNVAFIVLGSRTVRDRDIRSNGDSFAEGWSEPLLQKLVVGSAHRRRELRDRSGRTCRCGCWPWYPDLLLAPIGEGASTLSPAACPGPSASGVSGSRTGAMNCVTVCVFGSRMEMASVEYSAEPNSGP